MENTSNDADKGKRPTKTSASTRREKAAENPPKKRSRKLLAQSEAAETAHPEPEHHAGDPTQAE
ncbi:hypothetical protein A2U01_0077121, partial [Trifolium medium]|nr:hypothetical protein [Trifolium medium]